MSGQISGPSECGKAASGRYLVSRILLTLAMCLIAGSAHGQSPSATLSGKIVDETEAAVSDVLVTILNSATQLRREARTSKDGQFVIALLPPGLYSLTATRQGFAPLEARDLTLNVNDQVRLTLKLRIASIGESITVPAEPSRINTSSIGTVIDRQFVENLPLNGRTFQSLIALSPGVVLTKSGDGGQFSVNGQRASANYVMVDGVSANVGVGYGTTLESGGGGGVPAFSAIGSTNNLVSVDGMQEFKIETSAYAAEFGRTPGGQVSIVTRSGTNSFHASGFEYFRDDRLDATDWFVAANSLPKPQLRQNDFGVVVGGPIRKSQTFFFASYEGLRLLLPQAKSVSVPSLAARNGAPAQIRPLLNAFPIGNGPDVGNNLTQLSASYSDPSSLDSTSIRLDHALSDRATLFGRYNEGPSSSERRVLALSTILKTPSNVRTVTVGSTWLPKSHVTNELRVNYTRAEAGSIYHVDSFNGAILPTGTDVTNVTLASSSWSNSTNADNVQRQLNVIDTISVTARTHLLKFGVDMRRLSPVFEPADYVQSAQFASVSQALTGVAASAIIVGATGAVRPIFYNLSLFAQDSWRASSRLTLSFGARWEHNPPPREADGKDPYTVTGLDNPSSMALAPRGTPLYATTYRDIAPRIGASYTISEVKGREVLIKGGAGIFYDMGSGPLGIMFGGGSNYGYAGLKILPNAALPLDAAAAAPPPVEGLPAFRIFVADPRLKLPYTIHANIGVEQSLGANQAISAAYVTSAGRRLLWSELLANPNPLFANVYVTRNLGRSNYQALQIQFQRRLLHGLQALMAYTLSEARDNGSNESFINAPFDKIDPGQQWGPANFDTRHAFSAAATYNAPVMSGQPIVGAILGGWSVDATFRALSASPVNVVSGSAIFGVSSLVRPDTVAGVPLYVDDVTAPGGSRINRDAFTIPSTPRQGSLPRNALRGFPASQLDLAVRRRVRVTQQQTVQLSVECFNVFNHPNFADPNNALTDPLFGRSTQMLGRSMGTGSFGAGLNPLFQIGGPRSLQVSARLSF
jgi:hypothetical protein